LAKRPSLFFLLALKEIIFFGGKMNLRFQPTLPIDFSQNAPNPGTVTH
jgi:hypothetical protein